MSKEIDQKFIIVERAFESFMQEGPKNFTIESLASDLGMSKKTIYKYFPTKDFLIDKIFELFTDSIKRKFQSIANSDENPVIKFNLVTNYLFKKIMHIPSRTIMEVKIRYPHIWKKMEQFRLENIMLFAEFFKDAQKQGLAKSEIDMDKAAIIFINLINSTFQPEFFIENNIAPVDAIKLFMQMITEGIFIQPTEKKQNQNKFIWES